MTPFSVAETEDAVIAPFVGLVPCTVTVSPGFNALSDEEAFLVTFADELSVTLTRLPLEFVTYNVLPMMSVTVPVVEVTLDPVADAVDDRAAPAPAKPPRAPSENALALDELPSCFWRNIPPHSPAAASRIARRTAVDVRSRTPCLVVCVGQSSSPRSPELSPPKRGIKSPAVTGSIDMVIALLGSLSIFVPLFVTQGFDRSKRCSAVCGVEAEEDADRNGDPKGKKDGERCDDRYNTGDLEL